jgi:hypothetical protein
MRKKRKKANLFSFILLNFKHLTPTPLHMERGKIWGRKRHPKFRKKLRKVVKCPEITESFLCLRDGDGASPARTGEAVVVIFAGADADCIISSEAHIANGKRTP